jgi:hypothetical protein
MGPAGTRARGQGRQELQRKDGRKTGTRAQGRWRQGVEVSGARARAQGREAGDARSMAGDLRELKQEAGGRSVCLRLSDVSERPAVAREGDQRGGNGVRDSGGRPGRAGGSSSSSTSGVPLDGEELTFNFRCRDLICEESEC